MEEEREVEREDEREEEDREDEERAVDRDEEDEREVERAEELEVERVGVLGAEEVLGAETFGAALGAGGEYFLVWADNKSGAAKKRMNAKKSLDVRSSLCLSVILSPQ